MTKEGKPKMSDLKKKAFKVCIKWDSIGKTCLEEKYAVWLEDVEQEIAELRQKVKDKLILIQNQETCPVKFWGHRQQLIDVLTEILHEVRC